ncbi:MULTISPECIES: FtsW/RodA/SpoVE family cell cycle protein [Selenomonas]|uniref:FtsW/RodA/SpoVE family cell cycle protein n=1 Tax=Selenomonas TaxID=970 RepID=UPI0001E097E3|nr:MULTISPECIES: putative peptidoglycan glycosyltransferase FtsW [Selenomonas]AKT53398.1 stage V sporulation protein E [Selenomonas sp. oral taxon 478]AME03993.1 stage V sporulation protein E [Selenomonas sp. oral taxon 136]EFM22404.1 cell cycle protein, FtsW/RodA/SpoVE family [Selenomonas sp. oral taxon 149 str. 67H29BP]
MHTRYTLFKSETEPIVIVMVILLVTGTINVFSSSYVLAAMNFENPYYFLQRHLQWLLLGTIACWLCRRMNYQRLRGLMFIGLGINLFLLVAVLFVGTTINGAQRWIALGPLSFQPAEFAKLMGVLMGSFSISAVLAKERFRMDRDWPRVAIPFGAILLMAFLVYREPDFGTACIVFGVPLFMALVLLVPPRRWVLILIPVALAALAIGTLQPYRMKRMEVWLDPWSDARNAGYQMVQSLSTIGSGGIFGMGFGDGVSKYEYLPEAHTDFAFAIFSQEHGFFGVLLIFFLFAVLLVASIRVATRAKDTFGQVLALGIIFLVVGQALANLAMVAGLLPVVGVPLPFISYGGSSLIVTMAGMGMLLGIADRSKDAPPVKKKKHEPPEVRRSRIHVVQ